MAITHGMNTNEVKNLAKQLNSEAANIRSVVSKIDGILSNLGNNWKGNDFVQFRDWWESQHKKSMNDLAQKIDGLSTAAKNNAQRQEEISQQA